MGLRKYAPRYYGIKSIGKKSKGKSEEEEERYNMILENLLNLQKGYYFDAVITR